MGEDGKAVWTLSEATVGWTNETEGGRGLTATVPGVRLHLPPLFFFCCCFDSC